MDDNKAEEKADPNAEDGEEQEDLWQSFLREQSGKNSKNGHLIVLGNKNCGKTSIVTQFQKLESRFDQMKTFLLMRYAYLHLSDSNTDKTYAQLNIWQISEPEHCAVLKEVIPKEEMENVCWMICLDFSKPSLVKEDWEKWSKVAEETQLQLLERCNAVTQGNLKDKLYSHVQYYVPPNDADAVEVTEEEKVDLELQRANPAVNLGAPLIIVCSKIDLFKSKYSAEAQANDFYDIMLTYVRWWGLKYSAASFSMAKGLKEQARRILQYIDHRMFDTRFNRNPSVVVSLAHLTEEFLFVPTGYDSEQLIKSEAGDRSLEDPFEKYFAPSKSEMKKEVQPFKSKAEATEKFLKVLEWELKTEEENKESGGSSSKKQPDTDKAAVKQFFNRLLHTGQKS